MTQDVDALAAGLSEAQRRVLTELPTLSDGRALAAPTTRPMELHLRRLGLVEYYSAAYDKLTLLGLAVRAHLQSKGNARE